MPAATPPVSDHQSELLARLGERLRAERKRQKVSAMAAAEAAGMSRVTLHRIERGEPGVAMGAWLAAADALGLRLEVAGAEPVAAQAALPQTIRLSEYPQLRQIGWQLHAEELTPQEALSLYERNWRHVDRKALTMKEIALINALAATVGGGRPLV